ncbi:hypothetical protein C4565_00790 [Candidatus Parcubacteria bacterium]|nr:MAG: hypothetical protein C4565_00790 [Candidatus Parcubacteria bacterium]
MNVAQALTFWHVRMMSRYGDLAPHPGWVVMVPGSIPVELQSAYATGRVNTLGLDNKPDGEFGKYSELTADYLEFPNLGEDIAELY